MSVSVTSDGSIGGEVDAGYGAVADAFRSNFAERGEVGAAVAVWRDGRRVVDLWGGTRDADRRLPWQHDTLVPMFSTTKGVASVAVHLAHSRGWLDYDTPVAHYWPEFGQAGKEAITVRQLLSHQAGVAAIDERLTLDDLGDLDRLADILARQRPRWEPGTRHGYHAATLGFYENELVRRVDPHHRSIGRFFADEIADPLGIEFHIGLPRDVPAHRVAHVHGFAASELRRNLATIPTSFVLALANPWSLAHRLFFNPKVLSDTRNYNRREMLEVEIPAANGVGEVRAVARLFGSLATGGTELGMRPGTLAELEAPAVPPSGGLRDLVLHADVAWSLGYCKPLRAAQAKLGDMWFGTDAGRAYLTIGAGGSMAFVDPDVGLGFAYVPNKHGIGLAQDPRAKALHEAVYAVVAP